MKNQAVPVNIQEYWVESTEKGERPKCWGREINKKGKDKKDMV